MTAARRIGSVLIVGAVLSAGLALRAAPPIANAGPDQSVVSIGSVVALDGSASTDPDGDTLTYTWKFVVRPTGSVATLSSATSPSPTFVADRNGVYEIQLKVNAGSETATDTVTVTTANNAPTANAGADLSAKIGKKAKLVGTGSVDPDADKLAYQWTLLTQPEASQATIVSPTKVAATLLLDRPGTYIAELEVTDPFGLSDSDTVTITHRNSPPLSRGGPDQAVPVGSTVRLDASLSSDVDEDTLAYGWSLKRPQGSSATLSTITGLDTAFVADVTGTYVATVIARDGTVAGAGDAVVITAGAVNARPIAHAGADQRAALGQTVHLDGSLSTDPNGEVLTYAWTLTRRPKLSTAALSDPSSVRPSFAVDVPGTYIASLVVTDTSGRGSVADTATVTTAANVRPVANAGPDRVTTVGDPVMLRGSGSTDVNGQRLAYGWALLNAPAGSVATLTFDAITPLATFPEASAINPVFTPDVDGTYQFQLIVNDGLINSLADTVLVTTDNARPVADAGLDQAISVGATVNLDGSLSGDANGDLLTYSWSLMSLPTGSAAVLSDATSVTPSLTADLAGTYVAQLRVSDGIVWSGPDTVVITTGNAIPVANPGPDQDVTVGTTVALSATASSDADGDLLTYRWALLARPDGSAATLSSDVSPTPSFVADVTGTYVAQLVASDGTVNSAPATVTIEAATDAEQPVVSVTATDASAAETGQDPGAFAFTRTGPTTSALTVFFGVGGTSANGVDYTPALTGSVTIPPGSSSVLVDVTPVDDADFEGIESVVLTVSADAAYLVGSPNTATVNIVDNDVPTVTLTATDPNASEAGPDTGTLTFARTGSTAAPLQVFYTVEGTASASDYGPLSGDVIIPTGSATATVTVTPLDDAASEASESVIVTLNTDPSYSVGSPNSGTVVIEDNDPTVTLVATDPNAAEAGADPGTYTFTRTGNNAAPLTVLYSLSGTAGSSDYTALSGSIVIGAGQSSATVQVVPIDDADFEGPESVIATVAPDAAYVVGSPASATITIADNERPTVLITTLDANASEVGPDPGTYRLTRTGATTAPLSVNYTATGSATNGTDYATITSPIVFAAGQSTVDLAITPITDSAPEGTETVIVTITASPDYNIGIDNAFMSIADSSPTVSVQATDSDAGEDGPNAGTFTFTRSGGSGDISTPLTVNFTVGGTATSGSDYASIGTTVTILANQASAIATVTPIADNLIEGPETVAVTLAAGAYNIGIGSAVVTIQDSNLPIVTVAAIDPDAAEPGPDPGVFRFSRTGSTASSLTVVYTVGGTAISGTDYASIPLSIIIPAGQSTADRVITPNNDAQVEGPETVILRITDQPAYNLGAPGTETATVNIADQPTPIVSITAPDPEASEAGADPGTFRFTRVGDTTFALSVSYTVGGTAIYGTDYTSIPLSITIPAGQSTADRVITPNNDAQVEGPETVVLTITDQQHYDLGAPGSETATVTIADQPTPVVTITAFDPNASETGPDPGTFRFTRVGDTTFALSVSYTVGGTAIYGTDYASIPLTITIPANETFADRVIAPVDDAALEPDETVILTVTDGANYDVGAPGNATVTIADNDGELTAGSRLFRPQASGRRAQ